MEISFEEALTRMKNGEAVRLGDNTVNLNTEFAEIAYGLTINELINGKWTTCISVEEIDELVAKIDHSIFKKLDEHGVRVKVTPDGVRWYRR